MQSIHAILYKKCTCLGIETVYKKRNIMRYKWSTLLAWLVCTVSVFANPVPTNIVLDVVLSAQQSGRLNGTYRMDIALVGNAENGTERQLSGWVEKNYQAVFNNGFVSLSLGGSANPILPEDLRLNETAFKLTFLEGSLGSVEIPLPSTPYAIYAARAHSVDRIDAATITGFFVSTVNIRNDLHVGSDNSTAFHVDYKSQKVAIGKKVSAQSPYQLDVSGNIHADNFYLKGKPLKDQLFWRKTVNNNALYYNEGTVGIGTSTPSTNYLLDVVGTINATGYIINNKNLTEVLDEQQVWKQTPTSVFLTTANVGIGVATNINERLVVDGAIRIGKARQAVPKAGTLSFDKDSNEFYAYYADGQATSLTGAKLDIESSYKPGAIPYWNEGGGLTSTQNFLLKDGGLAIGTANPTALLTLEGDGETDYIHIISSKNTTALILDKEGKLGIGKSEAAFALDVNGVVNATDFFINGRPLESSKFSPWTQGVRREVNGKPGIDLFYLDGNVGLGTSTPANILEVAAVTNDVAITFDVAGTDYYSMGVSAKKADTFIISSGNTLDNPLVSFSPDSLGIGMSSSQATVHVSGNTGILVEGVLNEGASWQKAGVGTRMFFFPAKAAFRAGHVEGAQWDDVNIGVFSAAFGDSSVASGRYAFVGGGQDNVAAGQYAFVPGGHGNEALGDYSIAAGRNALANAAGSFVWSDATPSLNKFESQTPNQFLIRAYGGVGINTNQTGDSALVVSRLDGGNILDLRGGVAATETVLAVDSRGGVGIGGAEPTDNAALAVKGRVGIGTTVPKALLDISNQETYSEYLFYARSPSLSDSSSEADNTVVITASGNMGIGTLAPVGALDVRGDVYAANFILVDPNNPSNTRKLQFSSGSPWSDPAASASGNDTYRAQGFVGIGTNDPNSLLELSNQNTAGDMPVITFDYADNDVFKMGLITSDTNDVYFAMAPSGTFSATDATLVITNNAIIVGRGAVTSNFTLDVSGNMLIEGKFAVATDNVHSNYDAFVNGTLAVTTLNIAGTEWKPSDNDPWSVSSNGTTLFSLANVGIGTNAPTEALEVVGTISTNALVMGDIVLSGDLEATQLRLKDTVNPDNMGVLSVQSNNLYFTTGSSSIILSSPMKATQNVASGPLGYFADDNTIGYIPVYWDNTDQELRITGNLQVANLYEDTAGLIVSSNASFKDNSGFVMEARLSHKGDNASNVSGYTLYDLNLGIERDWGKEGGDNDIYGLNIALSSNGNKLLNQATAVGIHVDVSDVVVTEGNSGAAYAAIFEGGNVGIGTRSPSVALEVAGVISANIINLSDKINVRSLTVDQENYALVVTKNIETNKAFVAIGKPVPFAELDVNGLISANAVTLAGGLSATSLNIGTDALVIDQAGNIAIGSSIPTASFNISKIITSNIDINRSYIGEQVSLIVDGADKPGTQFSFFQNLTGLDFNLSTVRADANTGSFISDATVKGMAINLASANIDQNSSVYGLFVDVGEEASNRIAAVFKGGYVGIGTDTPETALHVSGDIKANSLILSDSLVVNAITTNQLIVQQVASFNRVTVNNLSVQGTLTADTLAFSSKIEVSEAQFNRVSANAATVNALTVSTITGNFITASTGYFTDSLSVGTTNIQSGTLLVDGTVLAQAATLITELTVPTLTVGTQGLVYSHTTKRLGIGTATPQAPVHVVAASQGAFSPGDTQTWNALRIGVDQNITNQAAGLLFAPEETLSKQAGAGLVAQATDQGAADLVFITDPAGGVPQERMRITSEGFLGIGVPNPKGNLDVAGTAYFSDVVTVNNTLFVSALESTQENSPLTINASGNTSFTSDALFKDTATFQENLAFTPIDLTAVPLPDDQTKGYLYVDATDNDLYFSKEGVSYNISSAYTGKPGSIPYFGPNEKLVDDAPFFYTNASQTIRVGDRNSVTRFSVHSSFTDSATDQFAEQLIVSFNARPASTTEFIGFDIQLLSDPRLDTSQQNAGRLGSGERAVGLNVDLSALKEGDGGKYAAIFNGGAVGIGTTDPKAMLHVQQDATQRLDSLFLIEDRNGVDLFSVSSNYVLVGQSPDTTPTAFFTIVNNDATQPIFDIQSSAGTSNVTVLDNGYVGIGTANPTAMLDVVGNVSANMGSFSTINSNYLNIGNGAFVMNETGRLAIGTDNVNLGVLTVYQAIDETLTAPLISEKVEVLIDGATAIGANSQSFNYGYSITGLDIAIGSQTAENTLTATAAGVSVNLSELQLADDATAYGMYIDMGDSTDPNRYAAYFGGKVGIATSNPSDMLTVSGTVRATGLLITGGTFEANAIKANVLTVEGNVRVDDTLTTQTLSADTVSVNTLIVDEKIVAGTGEFDSITVNRSLTLPTGSQLKIGTLTPDNAYALEVVGQAKFYDPLIVSNRLIVDSVESVDPNQPIVISSNVDILATVSVNQIMAKAYQLTTPETVEASTEYAQLYVNRDQDLIYALKQSTLSTVNITAALEGVPGQVPVYNTQTGNGFGENVPLNWNQSEQTLVLGDAQAPLKLQLNTTIDSSNTNSYTAQEVLLNFDRRTNINQPTVYTGVLINVESLNAQESNNEGRLGEKEKAIGLHVDLTGLKADYSASNGQIISPRKYAALFSGGLVGIGTGAPEAALHIKAEPVNSLLAEEPLYDLFRVDTAASDLNPAFIVSHTGKIGMNTAAPTARLTIQGNVNTTNGLFLVADQNGEPEFLVSQNAVAIGRQPITTVALSVSGSMQVNDSTNKPIFVVTKNRVAVGHLTPQASLDIQASDATGDLLKMSNGDNTVMLVDKEGNLTLGSPTPGPYTLNVKSNTGSVVFSGLAQENPLEALDIPSSLTTAGPTGSYGYLAASSSSWAFMGQVTNNQSVLLFGGQPNNQPTFNIAVSAENQTEMDPIMSFTPTGIGLQRAPSAGIALAVSGNMWVGSDTNDPIFYVDSNNVGIGTVNNNQDILLDVNGLMRVKSLEVTDSGIQVSTLNILGNIDLSDTISDDVFNNPNAIYSATRVSLNLSTDAENSIYGLALSMKSNSTVGTTDLEGNPISDSDPFYVIDSNADAYGLHVDISNVVVAEDSNGNLLGNKYAAVFKGGHVGIGTEIPQYPLHVMSNPNEVIAGFGTSLGGVVVQDYGSGTLGINAINSDSLTHIGLVVKPGETTGLGATPALIGIGTKNPDKALVVNGDMRLGTVTTQTINNGNYGSKLFFSGGSRFNADSDNGDDLWMARYNLTANQSRLRVNFSTLDDEVSDGQKAQGYDQFSVGYTFDSTFYPVFKVHNNSRVTVWGDTTDASSTTGMGFVPTDSTLFVRGSTNSNSNRAAFTSHVATLENASTEAGAKILALSFSNTEDELSSDDKFITFMRGNQVVGSIEGNNGKGVRYVTSGADYAEYLEKLDKKETFKRGDIVAVVNGKITKKTTTYQQLMVLSSAAAIAGNMPQGSKEDVELVAFFGQVPTYVIGPVNKGDYILPDNRHQGAGVAVSPDQLTIEDRSRIVGRAWESSQENGLKKITVAVGFAFGVTTLHDELAQVQRLDEKLDNVVAEQDRVLSEYEHKLNSQSAEIDALLLELKKRR